MGHPAADDLDPLRRVARRGHLDREPEPVEQLRPELALLGVHRPDQHEARGVYDGDPVPLDGRAAHGGCVQQQVDEVVVEQVDLVDVEDPAVGTGEQPGLVLRPALGKHPFQVQRAEHPVLGGPDRQLDQPHGAGLGLRVRPERAVERAGVRVVGIDGEPVAGEDVDRWQHRGQRPDHGGLRGALLAADQHPADVGRDRGQDQGERHVVGTDYGTEGKLLWHWGSRSSAIE